MRTSPFLPAVAALTFLLSACTQAQTETAASAESKDAATVAVLPATAKAADTAEITTDAARRTPLPLVTVHKSPTCGCCKLWVAHLEQAGFPVEVVESDTLEPIKRDVGVPAGMASCHTAQVAGYFVEGHVPADDIVRLITERPDAKGLAVPGMPLGSPGMEVPSGEVQPYAVYLIARDGRSALFSQHGR